jgi:MFS family permease
MNITWMCCARIVTGLGVGAIDAVIPVWSSEVSPHQARGGFLAIEFFLNISGLSLAYWIEIFASMNHNQVMAWRTPLALQVVFLLAILALVPFFPESPRWLAKVGRVSEARTVLQATRKDGVEAELGAIVRSMMHDQQHAENNSYLRMLFPRTKSQRELQWRVVLSVWLQIMQELVGIGVITVYAIDLIQGAGFSQGEAKLLAGFNNLSYMFSVLFAVFTLDRFGRRSTMVWGAAGMALLLLIGGILDKYAQAGGPNQRAYGAGVVTMTFLYTGTFGATWRCMVCCWMVHR